MNRDTPMPCPPVDHNEGLAAIIDIVRTDARGVEEWTPDDAELQDGPLRLLVSTHLSLVGVIDYRRAEHRLMRRTGNAQHQDVVTEIDQMARRLRFAINDADTAQVLSLIVAVPGESFREVAKLVFGPEGSRGEQVLRVVPTTPVPVDEADHDGAGGNRGPARRSARPAAELADERGTALRLDLEIVRPTLPTDIPSLQVASASEFAEAAQRVASEILSAELPGGEGNEAHTQWVADVAGRVARCFRDDRADSHPDLAAEALVEDMMALVPALAENVDPEGEEEPQ